MRLQEDEYLYKPAISGLDGECKKVLGQGFYLSRQYCRLIQLKCQKVYVRKKLKTNNLIDLNVLAHKLSSTCH